MPSDQDILPQIRNLNALGSFLGGTLDLRFEHTKLSPRPEYKDVDVSWEHLWTAAFPEKTYKDPAPTPGFFVWPPARLSATQKRTGEKTP